MLDKFFLGKLVDGILAQLKHVDFAGILQKEIHGLQEDSDHDGKTQLQNALDEFHQGEQHFAKAAQILKDAQNAK